MIEHNMKKRFGQNFLSDANLLSAIVRDAGITKQDEVLEIGAGAGALTTPLSASAKKVVSFEIDRELEPTLRALDLKNVEFVFADALKEKIEDIESHFEGEYKLVANIPYYITTPLLFKFLEESKRITSMTVMVQKEVADRLCATSGKDYGIISIIFAFYGSVEIVRSVSRKMFYPVPNVDSAVVRIDIDRNKFPEVDAAKFSSLVRCAFAMRRKTLGNNLSKMFEKSEINQKIGDFLSKRAEELSLDDFIKLYKALYQD